MENSIRQAGITPSRCRILMNLAVMVLLLGLLGFAVAGKAHAQDTDPEGGFVDGEIVAKLDFAALSPGQDCRSAINGVIANSGTNASIKEVFLENRNIACIYLLGLPEGSNTEDAAGRIANDQRIAYAEPNYTTDAPEDSRWMRFRADSGPAPSSDPAPYSGQYAVGALNLFEAHRINRGSGSTVAVLDTGVQLDHPELTGNMVPGYDFIGDDPDPSAEPNGIDDDGDGSTDEATGHGTHVAGIVHLTAPEAKIMPLRVLDSDGVGNIFVIAEAVQYAVDPDKDPRTDDGVDVINMSLGTSRESNLIQDIADDLDAADDDDDGGDDDDDTGRSLRGVPVRGVVVVGSAGNDNAEQLSYPSAEEGVIGVASVDQDEKKSDFSNYYGSPEVDISAPGDDIYSLFPTNQYAEWDGTSMAAPFVAGQAALIRSMRPGLPSTGPQGQPSVGEFIRTTARPLDAKNPDYSGKLGAGHADVYRSTLRANTAPAITRMRPAPGSRTRDRTPLLAATVGDAQTDLTKSDVRLFIDGRRIDVFSYNRFNDRLTRTANRLSYGNHRVRVTARDAQGLVATRVWGFRVIR